MSSEHIQVGVRLRPLNRSELDSNDRRIWTISKNSVFIRPESHHILSASKRISASAHPSFQFDSCFSWEDDTQRIYDSVLKRMVLSTLEGYNATIFAYGQTGSGKTFTMLGKPDEDSVLTNKNQRIRHKREVSDSFSDQKRAKKPQSSSKRKRSLTPEGPMMTSRKSGGGQGKGIMVLALEDVFQAIGNTEQTHYFLSCSYMEIYNEHIYDLLREEKEMKDALSVSETSEKEFYVKGLSTHAVDSIADVLGQLEHGEAMRHYAETNMNHHSSRSHTIFCLSIKSLQVLPSDSEDEKSDAAENVTTESVLNFVDLAGSERLSSTCSESSCNSSFMSTNKSEQDKSVAEGKHINTSLFYLCQVITKLSEQKLGMAKLDAYIPFRNSSLTKILRASLGGNARTCVLCTATPALSQFEQTLSTFHFGASARTITNKVQANIRHASRAQLLLAYEQDVSELRKELESALNKNRVALTETVGVKQGLENRIKRLTQLLYEKTKGVETMETVFGDWTPSAGDLASTEKTAFSNREIGGKDWKLKTDESGVFANLRSSSISILLSSDKAPIAGLLSSIQSLKTSKDSLNAEIDAFSSKIASAKSQKSRLKSRLKTLQTALEIQRAKSSIYEQSFGLEKLSDFELSGIEAELLIGLGRVKEAQANKRTANAVARLKNRLRTYISEAEIEKAAMDPEEETIKGKMCENSEAEVSFPSETMDSVNLG